VTRPHPGKYKRDQDARDARIHAAIDAVTELACRGGYEAVLMRDVARMTGMSLATLYRYFSSKDDLLRAASARQLADLSHDVSDRPPPQTTPDARVAEVFIRAFHAMRRNRGYAHAALSAYHTLKPLHDGSGDLKPTRMTAPEPHRFAVIAAAAAWGPDHQVTQSESQALDVLESLWSSSVVDWLNGKIDADSVDERLRFAASRLLPPSLRLQEGARTESALPEIG